MKRIIKEKENRPVESRPQNGFLAGYGPVGSWIVKSGVNHPLAFRQLLVRYFLVICFLLALVVTVSYYVRHGRHLHDSPQAEMPYLLTRHHLAS